jgi:hypothetical protein
MHKKEIFSVSVGKVADVIKSLHFPSPRGNGNVIGINLKENELSATLYNKLSKVNLPYILIIEVTTDAMERDLSGQNTLLAEKLLPLLMHHSQYYYFLHRPLLIKANEGTSSRIKNWGIFLLEKFSELGIKNVSLYYNGSDTKDGSLVFEQLVENGAPNNDLCSWQVSFIDDSEQLNTLIDANKRIQFNGEEDTLHLKEENAQLKLYKATLLKNIYDLNNYYRFVRGETTFKYQNRLPENDSIGPKIKPEEITLLINATGIHPSLSGVEELKAHYNKVYERLPSWYKKIGTILKIVLLKRELLYYISKRHKKIFFDTIYSLPDEKQIRIWYYYEYEILPGWYKWIGKFLRK